MKWRWPRLRLPKRRRTRIELYVLCVVLILVAADLLVAAWYRRVTVGWDTTRIAGPVRRDGTVNYVAALDAETSADVTAENNAYVLVLGAVGPATLDPETNAVMHAKLGIPVLPASGRYLVRYTAVAMRPAAAEAAGVTPERSWDDYSPLAARPWRAADSAAGAAWVRANEEPLRLLAEASRRDRWYLPLVERRGRPGMYQASLPNLGEVRELGDVCVARAMLRAGEGDGRGAIEDLLTVHRLARLMGGGATMIERLVAVGMEERTCRAEVALAAGQWLKASESRALGEVLAALPALPSMAGPMDRQQRYEVLDALVRASRHGVGPVLREIVLPAGQEPGGWYDWLWVVPADYDAGLRRANGWFDRYQAAMREPTYGGRDGRLRALAQELEQAEGLGKIRPTDILIRRATPMAGRAATLRDRSEAMRMVARAALALAAYKDQRGAYPERLEELVAAGLLKSVPRDVFVDGPLVYRREGAGCVVYSVGDNMKDDGGKGRRPGKWRKEDDLAAWLGVEAP